MKFKSIIACLDMYGCPNRCKHCWVGHSPNGNLNTDDLKFVAEQFRPFTDSLEIDDWYREPDFRDNYRELWSLCNELSDSHHEHFELISIWRLVRDKEYVKWLSSLGLKAAQLTLFGGREKTDFYTGRNGAYDEILESIEILLRNKISPRIQVFVNKDNIGELSFIENLITSLDLESRCKEFGGEFSFFLHQGSCDGENEKLYEIRVTPDDLEKIPQTMLDYTLKHFKKENKETIADIFGKTEQALYAELSEADITHSFVREDPVFFIDRDFNVYPNLSAPDDAWLLGNLKSDGISTVLENYTQSKSPAQHAHMTVPLSEIVKASGDPDSQRLFTEADFVIYSINKYCRAIN